MGAGGGAAVAVIAAAKMRRRQEVIDSFRLAGATSPDQARRVEEIGVPHPGEAEELLTAGVLVAGRREGTFYLDEAAYIRHRDRRIRSSRIAALVAILAMAIVLGLAALIRASRQ